MSNNTIAIIPKFELSADLLAEFAQFGTADDLDQGVSGGFPVMSIKGAKWRVVEGGEEHPVYMPGTRDLSPFVKVVIMRANGALSKTYYEGQFVEGSDAKPDCSSNDGVRPSPDSPKIQSQSCATCPKNEWGSKTSPSGAKIKACADVRRIAIVPAEDMNYSPILLRIPGASLSDLAQYGKALKQRGIPYSAVVTKLSFDADAAFPKIVFNFERVLTPDEMRHIVSRLDEPVIGDILGLNGSRAAALPAPVDDKFGIPANLETPAATPAPVKEEPVVQAEAVKVAEIASAVADDMDEEAEMAAALAAVKAKRAAKAKKEAVVKAEVAEAKAVQTPAPAAGGDDILSDLDSALAGLNM